MEWLAGQDVGEITATVALGVSSIVGVYTLHLWVRKKWELSGESRVIFNCPNGPEHTRMMKEIHTMTAETEKGKARGAYTCAWSQKEVIEVALVHKAQNESTRALIASLGAVSDQLIALATELRLTRNGGGK